MTRPATRQPPVTPPEPAPVAEPAPPAAERDVASARLSIGWCIAIFLWATSFAFLFFYEVLTSVLRLISNYMGWQVG